MKKIYTLVGKIIEIVQYLEHNLCVAIELDKIVCDLDNEFYVDNNVIEKALKEANKLRNRMQSMSFGRIMKIVIKEDFLEQDIIDKLGKILQQRNLLVHRFFKDSNLKKAIEREDKIIELYKFLYDATQMNDYLISLIKKLSNDNV